MRDKDKKDKQRAEVSKYNPVPLYRSYGSTKKEYDLWERFLVFVQKAFVIILMGLIFVLIATGIISWMLFGGILVQTIVITVTALILILKFTKVMRKRLSLNKKLKKACKENHYELSFDRPFFESLKWSEDNHDMTVVTKNAVFYVHLLAVPKYRCHVCFDSATEIRIVKPPLKNKFTDIFEFKTKTRSLSLDFSGVREFGSKKSIKVILVNPVCNEMYYKSSAVSTVQTGNGGEHFGYKIFTASGFINYLSRFEKEAPEASKSFH